jgi:hypothetical protein
VPVHASGSITPERATTSLGASVDQTDARNEFISRDVIPSGQEFGSADCDEVKPELAGARVLGAVEQPR